MHDPRAHWKQAFEAAFRVGDRARMVECEKVLEMFAELADAKERRDAAERAWAEAVNRARTAEDELAWLRKELEEEAE